MADEQLMNLNTDINKEDMQRVVAYTEAGMPGLADIDEAKLKRMIDMYFSGKTYRQIATTMSVKKDTVLYLSNRFNWYVAKQEYFRDLEANIRERHAETNIVSQHFLNDMLNFWHKKIGSKVANYLATGDESFANQIDLKDVDKYLKTLEVLQRLVSERRPSDGKAPAVGLNLGEGVNIRRVNDNEVEITPKHKTMTDMLKEFADSKREEQKQKTEVKHDINKEVDNQGEDNED